MRSVGRIAVNVLGRNVFCLYITESDPQKRAQMDKAHQEIHRRIQLIRTTDQPKKGEGGYWGKPALPSPPADVDEQRATPARLHQDHENWIVLKPWQLQDPSIRLKSIKSWLQAKYPTTQKPLDDAAVAA